MPDVALETGAARGIGQAIAVGLAERGANVVLGDVGDLAETSDLIDAVPRPFRKSVALIDHLRALPGRGGHRSEVSALVG
jgi:NAD(P)-dependent dehydrogenase (short-subunit alcohol dehydrogenase family)